MVHKCRNWFDAGRSAHAPRTRTCYQYTCWKAQQILISFSDHQSIALCSNDSRLSSPHHNWYEPVNEWKNFIRAKHSYICKEDLVHLGRRSQKDKRELFSHLNLMFYWKPGKALHHRWTPKGPLLGSLIVFYLKANSLFEAFRQMHLCGREIHQFHFRTLEECIHEKAGNFQSSLHRTPHQSLFSIWLFQLFSPSYLSLWTQEAPCFIEPRMDCRSSHESAVLYSEVTYTSIVPDLWPQHIPTQSRVNPRSYE